MICSWDAQFYKKMKQYSSNFRLPVPLVMQNMLIKSLAEGYAKDQIWGYTISAEKRTEKHWIATLILMTITATSLPKRKTAKQPPMPMIS
jgi:hypothetical protein